LLQLHHFYYGLAMLLMSVGFLSVTRRQRVRWDAALIFGIGAGLFADEAGLLLARIPYNNPISLLLLVFVGVTLFAGTANAAVRDGTREFNVLDRADILTMLSILLGVAGVLYLDRPLITIVEVAGGASWACAVVLMILFGKKHFLRIWRHQTVQKSHEGTRNLPRRSCNAEMTRGEQRDQNRDKPNRPLSALISKSKPTISRTRSSTLDHKGNTRRSKNPRQADNKPVSKNQTRIQFRQKTSLEKNNPLCLEGPATQEWLRGSFLIRRPRRQRWKFN
jgi:hypothetical protein